MSPKAIVALLLALPLGAQVQEPPKGDYYVSIAVFGKAQCELLFPRPYCKAVRPAWAKITNHTNEFAIINSEWMSGQANYFKMWDVDIVANGAMATQADKIGFRATAQRILNSPYFNFGITALATWAGGTKAGLATSGGITAAGQFGDAIGSRRATTAENVKAMSSGTLKLEPGGSGGLYLWVMTDRDERWGQNVWINADEEAAPRSDVEKARWVVPRAAPPRKRRCIDTAAWIADTSCGIDSWRPEPDSADYELLVLR